MKDLLSPELMLESRARSAFPELRRIFKSDPHEVFVAHYPGGLLATLVHYLREDLRIMCALGESSGDGDWAEQAIGLLKKSGKGPYQLVLDAKLQTRSTLTLHDRAALKLGGVEVPKSAGRYKDLFLQDKDL
jgi:hypothetical protein